MNESKIVSQIDELVAASKNAGIQKIIVKNDLDNVPSFRLSPGQTLSGADRKTKLQFKAGEEGVQLTSNNRVSGIHLETSVEKRAIFNDTQQEALGTMTLEDVVTIGQVQILVKDKVKSGNVEVRGLDIIAADTRGQKDRPQAYGVYATQGAFMLWNMQADKNIVVRANLVGLSAGRRDAPVIGSGVMVSGHGGLQAGSVSVATLQTDAIYSTGKIPAGTPDIITGGVFVAYGAYVSVVHNLGPVETYGVNDMVLDNWGYVDEWIAEESITSYGPSGIGFVNFGMLQRLIVNGPIETFGQGARGFNVYAGSANYVEFDRIITHADGAVGIQVSQPIGTLLVHRGIETFGGTGESLVKGVVTTLSAIALSVKVGGSIRELHVGENLTTHGKGVAPLEINGSIKNFTIKGEINAVGGNYAMEA